MKPMNRNRRSERYGRSPVTPLAVAAVFGMAAALYPQTMNAQATEAQQQRAEPTVAGVDDLAAPGDLWIETRTVAAEDGTEVTADYGRLVVPENRAKADTNPIQIAFVRLRGPESPVRAPVVYLAGGPGGSASWQAEEPWALQDWIPLLADGDVILLDQRGTGESTPRLRWRWPGLPRLEALGSEEVVDSLAIEMATRAREYLAGEGHDLAGYTSVESARDIDALRAVLGHERISLLGFSYGTHLGIAYARAFPDRVESMVLAGVEGPDQTLKLPLHMDTAFRRLARMVAADPELGPEIPDLVALLERVQRKLEAEPVVVTLTDPEDGATYDVPVGRHFLDYIIRRDIGDASDLPVFPRLLYSIDRGDPSVLQWFVQKRAGILVVVDGMSAVMDIASGASPERTALIEAQTKQSMFGNVANFPMPLWNEAWAAPDLGDEYRSPLISDVRTLLLSGTLDWNTPPFQAEQLRWGMTNATHLVVENAGHEQVLPHPEIWTAVRDFLRGRDVSGVRAAHPPIEWVPLEGYDPERTHPSVPGE